MTTPAEKIDFEAFLAKVPDAPASKDLPAEASTEAPKAEASDSTQMKDAPTTLASAEKPTTTSSNSGAGSTPDAAALLKALKEGDLDALGELTGEDPELYDEKSKRWAARKRKESKLVQDREAVYAKAETVVQRWAPVNDLAERVKGGDFAALPELVQTLTGQDWDSAAMKAFRAVRAQDPRVAGLTARATKAEKERDEAVATRADSALAATVRDEVAARDPVRKIEGWEAKVAAALKAEYDQDLGEPRISVKQAATRVVKAERTEYERLSRVFAETAAPATPVVKAPERASGASGVGKRKLSRDEWLKANGA